MILTYLNITFRSMMKNKVFILINVFGMGIAIACCIVSYFAYQYDNNFDRTHQNHENIYRISSIRSFDSTLTHVADTPMPLAEIVDKTFPDVDYSSVYQASHSNFKIEDNLFAGNLSYVEPDFFQMFTFDFIAGVPSAFDKSAVMISESMAIRFFGTAEAAFGKMITQVYGNELKEVKIAAVFREPASNSSFYRKEGSAYMHADNYKDEFAIQRDDWKKQATIFIQIIHPERVDLVRKQLQSYRENNNKVRLDFQISEFTLDPFTSMAHTDRDLQVLNASTWPAPPAAAIVGSMIMSGLILLIACFNLTNTTIAISSRRLKEIGIRKVMGSVRVQLILQFIGETTMICLIAIVVALGLSDFMIGGWNVMTGNNIHLEPNFLDDTKFWLFLAGLLLFTGVMAGSYPAFYISKFKPISILKGKLKLGGTNYFTRVLLGLQFAISLISIVSAIGLLQNARYQHNYDLGFDIRGSIIAWVENENEFDIYRNKLQGNPEILSVAGARSGIFSNRLNEPVKYQSTQAPVDIIEVGDNYLRTLDLKLIEGRDFIRDSETDQNESVIITQKMAGLFGWDEPLGKEIIWRDTVKLFVVGVIKDVHTQGFWKEMEPMMVRYIPREKYNQIVVSTRAENIASVNAFMQAQWSQVFPYRLYNGYLMESVLRESNTLGMSIVYGYTFLGAIAMLLSATGLYTLLSLNIIRRTKEIGIRKIVGAPVSNITRIVNTEFVIILVIAAMVGSWASYQWCTVIMSSIWKYYQGVGVSTFVFAVGLLFLISFITIGNKILTVARMNPIDTLRDE